MSNIVFVNLTPHRLNIYNVDGREIIIEPSGSLARVEDHYTLTEPVAGIPVTLIEAGQIIGLPEPQDGYCYIVSGKVEALAGRDDVYCPGMLERNGRGQVIGCHGLKQHRRTA